MINHETTLKNHGNQPKTMISHETTWKNHGGAKSWRHWHGALTDLLWCKKRHWHGAPTDLLWCKKRHWQRPRQTSFGAKNVTDTGPQPTSFGAINITDRGPDRPPLVQKTSLTRGPDRPPLVQKTSLTRGPNWPFKCLDMVYLFDKNYLSSNYQNNLWPPISCLVFTSHLSKLSQHQIGAQYWQFKKWWQWQIWILSTMKVHFHFLLQDKSIPYHSFISSGSLLALKKLMSFNKGILSALLQLFSSWP